MFHLANISHGALGALLLKTFGLLAIMGLATFVLMRVMARRYPRIGTEKRMRVLDRLVLEPRKSLYMVEIDGRTHVLGVCDGSIHTIETPDPEETSHGDR